MNKEKARKVIEFIIAVLSLLLGRNRKKTGDDRG